MGGEVFVGVRDSQRREHLSLRWTNIMPSFLSDPTFYSEGEAFREFIDRATPENEWPQSKKIDLIEPSEYGVILIDFPNKRLFSRQDYSTPGQIALATDREYMDPDKLEKLLKIKELGWPIELCDGWGVEKLPEITVERLWRVMKGECQEEYGWAGSRLHYFTANFVTEGWTFDRVIERALYCWDSVLVWLHENKWTSKTMSEEAIEELLREDD